jgi:hypothetical protein
MNWVALTSAIGANPPVLGAAALMAMANPLGNGGAHDGPGRYCAEANCSGTVFLDENPVATAPRRIAPRRICSRCSINRLSLPVPVLTLIPRFQPVLGHTFRPITAKAIAGLLRPGTRPGANTRAEAGAWRGERIGCDTYRIITDFP